MEKYSKSVVSCLFLVSFATLCVGQIGNMDMLAAARGMNSRMSASIGIGVAEMPPMQYATLDKAVKNVVGPHASPDIALITYASQQGGPPRTVFQIFGYIPFLQNIARTVGIRPVPGDTRSATGGKNINDIVTQRSIRWIQKNSLMIAAGAAM